MPKPDIQPKEQEFTPSAQIKERHRVRRCYRIPQGARLHDDDPIWVVVRELTGGEIDDAVKIAGTHNRRTAMEMGKLALDQIGYGVEKTSIKQIKHEEGEHELIWDLLSPKVRALVLQAAQRLNSTTDEEDTSFFDSEETL